MPRRLSLLTGLAAAALILLSLVMLERDRAGLEIRELNIGTTPATLYQRPGALGPVVVIAHGFAGSRQIMQAYSLRLAQAGYRVLAYDLEGHGRNLAPMSGDVTTIDGTTSLLVAETQRVIAAARALPSVTGIALLGHSMATDIIVRASLAEVAEGRPIDAVVGISLFSQAITAEAPARLLIISGQWEPALRQAALEAVHLVDPKAAEGTKASTGDIRRLAVVAPRVEHVGVLFSPTAVDAAQEWLDSTFGQTSTGAAAHRGPWILALLAGIVLAARPLVGLLPKGTAPEPIPARQFWAATLLPTIAVPLIVAPLYSNFLPVLVADYLMLHLAAFGVMQLALLGGFKSLGSGVKPLAVLGLAIWGILVFGLALDRYAASFWPTATRLPIIGLLCLGTMPFMLGDSLISGGGTGRLWRRVTARVMGLVSLGIAAVINPNELMFVLIVLPVFVLFYAVHGLMGRWVGQRSGALAAGLGLGLCLAWALGVSFPLFANG